MDFRGRPAADDGRRFSDHQPPHVVDPILVIKDALLSQLQKDCVRQEIIVAELAKIERVMKDRVDECFEGSCSADGAAGQENATLDDCKQGPNEAKPPKTASPCAVKWSCDICQVKPPSRDHLLQHFAGQKHLSKVATLVSKKNGTDQMSKSTAEKSRNVGLHEEKPPPTWVCRFCQSNCTCKSDLENHLKGKRHQAKIQALLEECKSMACNYTSREANLDPNVVPQHAEDPASTWSCSLCQAKCTSQSNLESHLRGKRHQLNFLVLQIEAKRYLSKWGCGICQAKCNSKSQFEDHCRSRKHQQQIEVLEKEGKNVKSSDPKMVKKPPSDGSNGKGASSEEMDMQRTLYFCKLCNLQCNSEKMLSHHRTGKKHLAKLNCP